ARTPVRTGRQRVRPPPPPAVHQQPDADVLAWLVIEAEAPARLDDQRRGVVRLAPYVEDTPAQFPRRPQRIGEAQIVIGQQRRGDASSKGAQRMPAGVGLHSGQRNGPGLDDVGGGSRYFSVHCGTPDSRPDRTYGTVTYGTVARVRAAQAGTAALGPRTKPGRDPVRHRRSARRP